MEWAVEIGEAKQLPPDARAGFVMLAYYANRRSGWAWPSRAEMMAKTGFGTHRMIRALADIEAAGIIGVERRKGKPTRWGPFPILVNGLHPRGRPRDSEPEPDTTRATVRATTRATVRATPARPGARDPLETPMSNPAAAVAARRSKRGGSTWVATLPPAPNLSDLRDDD